jgi:hypothetical protein
VLLRGAKDVQSNVAQIERRLLLDLTNFRSASEACGEAFFGRSTDRKFNFADNNGLLSNNCRCSTRRPDLLLDCIAVEELARLTSQGNTSRVAFTALSLESAELKKNSKE